MRRDRGQSLVELALLLPILFILIGLTIDMGRGIQAYITVNNAAREAVRYASMNPTDTAGITNIALEELERGGLTPGNATVTVTGSGTGNPIQVTVTYAFPLFFDLISSSQLTIQSSAEAVIF